jgi:hypothetical protein
MFSRTLKIAALALATAGVFAGSAQASVIDTDDVILTSVGFDVGDNTFSGGAPTGPGEIHFHHENGTIRPHLLGYLHMKDDDGLCGRVRLRYFNSGGIQLAEKFGGTVCVSDDLHHSWSVDLDPYSNPDIASVEVAVMKITATSEVANATGMYTMTASPDTVLVDTAGADLGSTSWSGGSPTGSAVVAWQLDGATARPLVLGQLTLKGTTGACGRVNLRYLDATGVEIDEKPGGTVCAPDKAAKSWSVNLDPFESDEIESVEVQVQTLALNGTWLLAGSQTVALAE